MRIDGFACGVPDPSSMIVLVDVMQAAPGGLLNDGLPWWGDVPVDERCGFFMQGWALSTLSQAGVNSHLMNCQV